MIGLPLLLFGVFFTLERRARRRRDAGDLPDEPGQDGPDEPGQDGPA